MPKRQSLLTPEIKGLKQLVDGVDKPQLSTAQLEAKEELGKSEVMAK